MDFLSHSPQGGASNTFSSPPFGHPFNTSIPGASLNHDGTAAVPLHQPSAPASSSKPKGKRKEPPSDGPAKPKAIRACDRCRIKKTKCDLDQNQCVICTKLDLTCTFDIPITETRNKRINKVDSIQATVKVATVTGSSKAQQLSTPIATAAINMSAESSNGYLLDSDNTKISIPLIPLNSARRNRPPAARFEGCTSINYILHSTPTLPIPSLSSHDLKYHISMDRIGKGGDGRIQILHHPTAVFSTAQHQSPELAQFLQVHPWEDVIESLVRTYFSEIAALFPIILAPELLAYQSPPPLLVYAICGVATCRRTCLKSVHMLIRNGIDQMLKDDDVLSDVSVLNVQILLILSISEDLLSTSSVAAPENVGRSRLQAAIRMAVDLGLNSDFPSVEVNSELRRRIWCTALVLERWWSAKYGIQPTTLEFHRSSGVRSGSQRSLLPDLPRTSPFMSAMTVLSHLLFKVCSRIYGPEGLKSTNDSEVEEIKEELEIWREKLPPDYKFDGPSSSMQAGLLHLLFSTVLVLLYRCFMRFSFICPSHFSTNVDIPTWFNLLKVTTESLTWVAQHDESLDVAFMVSYCVGVNSIVQYHTWARRKEQEGVQILELVQAAISRWEGVLASEDHFPLRRRDLDVVSTMLFATKVVHLKGQSSFESERGLNPTPGVLNSLPTAAAGFAFLSDPSRPTGGVLVVTEERAKEMQDLPPGTVIIGGSSGRGSSVRVIGEEEEVQVQNDGGDDPVLPMTFGDNGDLNPEAWSQFMSSWSFPFDFAAGPTHDLGLNPV